MPLRYDQLEPHLHRPLRPVYLLAGGEPVLLRDAQDRLRAAARAQGYVERLVFELDAQFDWTEFRHAIENLGLFASRRLIELRLPTLKLDAAGAAALADYLALGSSDLVLLLSAPECHTAGLKSPWVESIERHGAVLALYPIKAEDLPRWLIQRARALELHLEREAADWLAERCEGHVLAATQALELIHVQHGPGRVGVALLETWVDDSARFTAFRALDAVLAGDPVRLLRVLRGLSGEGVDPVLVYSLLAAPLEQLAQIGCAASSGPDPQTCARQLGVREAALGAYVQAARRGDVTFWTRALLASARVDQVLKGRGRGAPPWVELERLLLGVCRPELARLWPETEQCAA